ncbi:hypothetical protein [Streptomyces sp. NPDC056921]|uniref:hypothetical protein n=1 Tax=Streptomyces sp. NPDC056921 TaxID=3345966 RepID=UPI00363DE5FE
MVGAALGAGAVAFSLGFPGPAALITAGVVMLAAGFLTGTAEVQRIARETQG